MLCCGVVQAFLRLMRYLVNAPKLLVCATKDGITPFITRGDWREGQGRSVSSVVLVLVLVLVLCWCWCWCC